MRVVFLLLLVLAACCEARRRVARQVDDYDIDEDYADISSYSRCNCEGDRQCYCVQDHLCLVDGTIATEGAGILIPRSGANVEKCIDGETCCKRMDEMKQTTTTTTTEATVTSTSKRPPVRCGMKGSGVRVTDTTETYAGEFPWMLAIFKRERGWEFHCGASLIGKKFALTAAHCVQKYVDRKSALQVRAGVWDLDSEGGNYQKLEVAEIIIHEDYQSKTLRNDIALIKTDENFKRSATVNPVCLYSMPFIPGTRCIATGWGRTNFGKGQVWQPQMKQVEIPLVNRNDCQATLRKTMLGRYFNLHESFLCAGGENNVDTCQGDGGGPLVCSANGTYVQAGIVSWGVKCGINTIPGIYTDVSRYNIWIYTKMKAQS